MAAAAATALTPRGIHLERISHRPDSIGAVVVRHRACPGRRPRAQRHCSPPCSAAIGTRDRTAPRPLSPKSDDGPSSRRGTRAVSPANPSRDDAMTSFGWRHPPDRLPEDPGRPGEAFTPSCSRRRRSSRRTTRPPPTGRERSFVGRGPYWTATPPRIPEDSGHSEQGGAQSGAPAHSVASDPLLAELLKQWHRLTLEDRERIAVLLHHGGMR
jgi:hypothetical protein